MTRRRLVAVTLIGALAVPVYAAARVPNPKSKLIVFGQSAGGVKLGQPYKTAQARWGKGKCSSDATNGTCQYAVGNGLTATKYGSASFAWNDGKISSLSLSTGSVKGKYVTAAPLGRLKTAKGIGLSSTKAAFKRAYPRAEAIGATGFRIKGPGKHVTIISAFKSSILQINIQDGVHQS